VAIVYSRFLILDFRFEKYKENSPVAMPAPLPFNRKSKIENGTV